IGNEFLYTGRRLDPETGLYQYRFRYYHAQLGRFVTRDPIKYEGGTSLYAYIGGKPTSRIDPLGLVPFHDVGPGAWVPPGASEAEISAIQDPLGIQANPDGPGSIAVQTVFGVLCCDISRLSDCGGCR